MKLKLLLTGLLIVLFVKTNVMAQFITSYTSTKKREHIKLLDDYKGNIVVISILNVKSLHEIKELNKLVERYKGKKVTFIAISDGDKSVKMAIDSNSFQFKYIQNEEESEKIFNKYQTGMFKAYPMHIILNEEGKTVFKKQKTIENINKKFIKKLDGLLSKMSSSKIFDTNENYTIK